MAVNSIDEFQSIVSDVACRYGVKRLRCSVLFLTEHKPRKAISIC